LSLAVKRREGRKGEDAEEELEVEVGAATLKLRALDEERARALRSALERYGVRSAVGARQVLEVEVPLYSLYRLYKEGRLSGLADALRKEGLGREEVERALRAVKGSAGAFRAIERGLSKFLGNLLARGLRVEAVAYEDRGSHYEAAVVLSGLSRLKEEDRRRALSLPNARQGGDDLLMISGLAIPKAS